MFPLATSNSSAVLERFVWRGVICQWDPGSFDITNIMLLTSTCPLSSRPLCTGLDIVVGPARHKHGASTSPSLWRQPRWFPSVNETESSPSVSGSAWLATVTIWFCSVTETLKVTFAWTVNSLHYQKPKSASFIWPPYAK